MSETLTNTEPGREIINDVIIRFAGDGGEGVITSGEFVATAASRMGLEILKVTSLPAEIKGGPAMIQVRLGQKLPQSQGSLVDMLVCFNDEVYHLHKGDLKPNGILLYDSECNIDDTNAEALKIEVPFGELAKKEAGGKLAKNMVVMGSVGALLGIAFEEFEKLAHAKFDRKGEKVVEANLNGLRIGYEYVQSWVQHVPFHIEAQEPHHKLLMTGNDAIALGAVASGLSFFAGYPITPASTILEKLVALLPKFGGKVIQAEDEIAALAMVLGASFAGHKSATATSGPGVSLMTEEIGLASMTELPCVIFDAQRGGPSTGLPTKQEQSDLNLAIYGGHGDAPRLVLAPANVEDCFHLTVEAFNLSEMCQMPTLLLTDFYLAQAGSTIAEPNVDEIEVINRLRPTEEDLKDYKRFALTENSVSPMAKPGEDPVYFVATGLEHNEKGNPDISPAAHRKMSDKRHLKPRLAMEYAEKKGTFARRYGARDAKIGIITWGSTEGAISEAIDLAAKWDLGVEQLHLLLLNPLPEKEIYDFIYSKDKVIVAELNYTGQLAQRLRAALSVPVDSYTKCTGQPFTPYEIFKEIMVLHGWDAEKSDPVLTQVARVQHQYQVPIPTPGHQGQDEHMAGSVAVNRF
jgi:2-oxoglutarate ferredoxin oxidoreductase subunit alpha